MASSIRRRLLDAVLEGLRTIRVADGYRTTVQPSNVFRGAVIPDAFPALVVIVGPETPEESSHDLSTYRLGLTVEVWVDREDGRLDEALEDLVADVRQCLQSYAPLWSFIVELNDRGASAPYESETDEHRAQCALPFEVVYRHSRTNPSLLV